MKPQLLLFLLLLSCGSDLPESITIPTPGSGQGGVNIQVCATSGTTGSCAQGSTNTNAQNAGIPDLPSGPGPGGPLPIPIDEIPECDPDDERFAAISGESYLVLSRFFTLAPVAPSSELVELCGDALSGYAPPEEFPHPVFVQLRGNCIDLVSQIGGPTETYTLISLETSGDDFAFVLAIKKIPSNTPGAATLEIRGLPFGRSQPFTEPQTVVMFYKYYTIENPTVPCATGQQQLVSVPYYPPNPDHFTCDEIVFPANVPDLAMNGSLVDAVYISSSWDIVSLEEDTPGTCGGVTPQTINFPMALLIDSDGPTGGCAFLQARGLFSTEPSEDDPVIECSPGAVFPSAETTDTAGFHCRLDERGPAPERVIAGLLNPAGVSHLVWKDNFNGCRVVLRAELTPQSN